MTKGGALLLTDESGIVANPSRDLAFNVAYASKSRRRDNFSRDSSRMARVLIAGDAPENALFTAFKDTGNKVVMVAMFFCAGPARTKRSHQPAAHPIPS